MNGLLKKIFFGIPQKYFLRQLMFSITFFILFVIILSYSKSNTTTIGYYEMIIFYSINTILYPYSRFLYESITSFILGDNIVAFNFFIMMIIKILSIIICWQCAIIFTPLSLIYIYFVNRKKTSS